MAEPFPWAGFLVGLGGLDQVLCTPCLNGEHVCPGEVNGGVCACRDALCLQRRVRLGLPIPADA